MSRRTTRTEHDLLGERSVPAAAYYGIHTLRPIQCRLEREQCQHTVSGLADP